MGVGEGSPLEGDDVPSRGGDGQVVDLLGGGKEGFVVGLVGYGDKGFLPGKHQYQRIELNSGLEKYRQAMCLFEQNIIIRSMDPRPYHFDYRRPRLNNPTYLSRELIDRLQQKEQQRSPSPSPSHQPSSLNPELKRANSTDINASKGGDLQKMLPQHSRQSLSSANKLNNSMANYGRNLLGQSRYEQEDVFQRQERRFNIISYWPRAVEPNLKQFPKLTMEDKLLESGISPS